MSRPLNDNTLLKRELIKITGLSIHQLKEYERRGINLYKLHFILNHDSLKMRDRKEKVYKLDITECIQDSIWESFVNKILGDVKHG